MTTPRPPDEVFCLTCGPGPSWSGTRGRRCWRHSSPEAAIAGHQRFAGWLRTHIQPCDDTSAVTPEETAVQIATWVRHLLAEDRAGLSPDSGA